jgi:hypothetical protein
VAKGSDVCRLKFKYDRFMKDIFPIAVRAAFTFVAFLVIQYKIPYYLLVLGGLGAAVFMWKTSDDRSLTLGILIGSVLFGIFAFLFGKV